MVSIIFSLYYNCRRILLLFVLKFFFIFALMISYQKDAFINVHPQSKAITSISINTPTPHHSTTSISSPHPLHRQSPPLTLHISLLLSIHLSLIISHYLTPKSPSTSPTSSPLPPYYPHNLLPGKRFLKKIFGECMGHSTHGQLQTIVMYPHMDA